MAGTPYLVGSNTAASGGSTALVVAVATAVASGDLLYIGILMNTATSIISVVDSQLQNWQLMQSDVVNTTTQLYIFSPGSSVALSTSDTITVNYAANSSVQGAIVVADNVVDNMDKIVLAHGTSTAPSVASGTLSQAEENCIGFIVDTNAGGTPTWNATFSGHVLANITAAATTKLSAAYAVVNSTSSVTAAGTIVSANWAIGIVTDAVTPPQMAFTLSEGIQTETYSQTLESTGGVGAKTYSLVGGAFPTGITMTAGVISGTPSVNGIFPLTIRVTDASGATSDSVQVLVILPNGASPAPNPVIPTNLLLGKDSNFETGTPTWAAETNAGTPVVTSITSFTGTKCLAWQSLADGLTQIATGFYTVLPNQGYIASGYLLPTGNQGNDCFIGIEWYTSGNTLIRTDLGTDLSSFPLTWQGMNVTAFSPSNAAKAKVVCQVAQSNKGDWNHLEMVALLQSETQVLIDFVNPPFGVTSNAGNDFFDVSPWVRMADGIDINRGRSDNISEITAGTVFFGLQNDTGMFTRYNTASPAVVMGGGIRLQQRVQVNVCDELGIWHTRFDGAISQIDYEMENTGNTCFATFHGSDVLAELNRQDPLACWTKEQILLDSPAMHWSLDDAPNAGGTVNSMCAESSGNGGPPLRLINTDNTNVATVVLQDNTSGVEILADAVQAGLPDGSAFWSAGSNVPNTGLRGLVSGTLGPFASALPSVNFQPVRVAQSAQNKFIGNKGFQLQALLPSSQANLVASGGDTALSAITANQNFTVEAFFMMDPAISTDNALNYGPYTVFSLGSARTTVHTMVAGVFANSGGNPKIGVKTYTQPPGFFGKNFTVGTPSIVSQMSVTTPLETRPLVHHLVVTVSGDAFAPTVTGYYDGVNISNFGLPAGQAYDTLCVGGAYGGTGCFKGNISLVTVYPYVMDSNTIQLHTQLGQIGNWEMLTDDCIGMLAKFADIPSFWNNLSSSHLGLSLTEYQDITGSNALANMNTFENTERGLLFVDAAGTLQFHTRDWRMGYGPPDLLLPPDTFDADMGFGVVDQFQVNEAQIGTVTLTGVTFVNNISQAQYGVYFPGGSSSLPLVSWSRGYSQLGLPEFSFWPEPNLVDYVAWDANSKADPWMLPSQITIDLISLNPNTGLGISSFYALEIDNMVAPTGTLPTYFPNQNYSTEWFIEGINEHISETQHTIQFFTSPAEPQRAWKPGHATYGVLGSTSRIGISEADSHAVPADGKDVGHDGGPPFWAPTFSVGSYLTGDATTFEGGIANWTNTGNAAVTSQTTQAHSGTHSMRIRSLASGDMSAGHCLAANILTQGYPCLGGQSINVSGWFRSAVNVRQVAVGAAFYDFTGTIIGAAIYVPTVADSTSAWTLVSGAVTAPAGSIACRLMAKVVGTAAINEDHFFDDGNIGSNAMNNPGATGQEFIGGLEIRGMTDTLGKLLEPPMSIVAATGGTQQNIGSGSLAQPQLFWDTIYTDTATGMGIMPGWPNWYVCLVPGFYEIDATIVYEKASTLGGQTYMGWIVVAIAGAQNLLNGTADPTTQTAYNFPIGESVRRNQTNVANTCANPTERVYLGLGDMITVAAEQDSGAGVQTANALNGCSFSIRWLGYSVKDDRFNINSSLSSGGTVGGIITPPTPGQFIYNNTHTYSYYGNSEGGKRRNTDGVCYQGYGSGLFNSTGSQKSQVAFDFNQIKSDLTGKTITSVTLHCKNDHTWYSTGGKLQVGVYFDASGSSVWKPTTPANAVGPIMEQHFDEGQTLTFTIPNSVINYFVAGDGNGHFGKGIRVGPIDEQSGSTDLNHYGYWHGGPNQWTLTVNYH